LVGLNLSGMIHDSWPKRFAREGWQSGSKLMRGSMVQDVIISKIAVGKSRSEVLDLFGTPEYCFADLHEISCTDEKADSFEYSFTARPCHLFWGCTLEVHFGTPLLTSDSIPIN